MPPKTTAAAKAAAIAAASTTPAEPESLEDVITVLKSLANQFTTFGNRLDAVDITNSKITSLENKLVNIETKLEAALADNKKLKEEISTKNKIIEDIGSNVRSLEAKCNDLEQYNRSWSIRAQNIPLAEDEVQNPAAVRDKLYNLALLPIFKGALEKGLISAIPEAEHVLETAHVLPGKQGEHRPIIARFYNRNDKALCLRLKREFAPRTSKQAGRAGTGGGAVGGTGSRPEDGGWYTFPFQEDLTRVNFMKMRAISKHEQVQSCWSVNGSLRFRLVNSIAVKRVVSVFDPVEAIITKK
jgi:prefoldin subunit 5